MRRTTLVLRTALAGAALARALGAASLLRASRVSIESDGQSPVQLDGDAAGTTPARLEVDTLRTRLLVP